MQSGSHLRCKTRGSCTGLGSLDFASIQSKLFKVERILMGMETITVPKVRFEKMAQDNEKMKEEIEVLRKSRLYKRLLECLENLKVKEYTRKDLGI